MFNTREGKSWHHVRQHHAPRRPWASALSRGGLFQPYVRRARSLASFSGGEDPAGSPVADHRCPDQSRRSGSLPEAACEELLSPAAGRAYRHSSTRSGRGLGRGHSVDQHRGTLYDEARRSGNGSPTAWRASGAAGPSSSPFRCAAVSIAITGVRQQYAFDPFPHPPEPGTLVPCGRPGADHHDEPEATGGEGPATVLTTTG